MVVTYLINHVYLYYQIFMTKINKNHIGSNPSGIEIDESYLEKNDNKTFSHDIEKIGLTLRKNMSNMKKLK